jgi:hypothetical protein
MPSALRAANFPPAVEARYATYKQEVLQNFVDKCDPDKRAIDKRGFVCNRNGDKFIDQGDACWRTSLFLFCLAVELKSGADNAKQNADCQHFLRVLDSSWKDGKPVRHPSDGIYQEYLRDRNLYSRDQFCPQLAALYYCYKFGDATTKKAARDLLERFIRALMKNDWQFNMGQAADLGVIGRFVLREVAETMDLGNLWEPAKVDEKNPLKRAQKEIERKVELEKTKLLYDGYRELWVRNLDLQTRRIKFGIGLDGNQLPQFDPDKPMEFYAIHNLFWEILMVYECRGQTADLRERTARLAEACERHNMAPLLWLAKREEKPRAWLAAWSQTPSSTEPWDKLDSKDWPLHWQRENYVWQRNLAEQRAAPNEAEKYPRLDYMVLRRLFDLDSVRR